MTRSFFVTGTDTGSGKTVASRILMGKFALRGERVIGYKPVATGCENIAGDIRSDDALLLQRSSNVGNISYDLINPFRFVPPIAPHTASVLANSPIRREKLSQNLQTLAQLAEILIVEGAGGWFTPLGENFSYSDWVIEEQLPVILVIGIRVGCVNHALLTELALLHSGLKVIGWIANHLFPTHRQDGCLLLLQSRLSFPCLGTISFLEGPDPIAAENSIDIDRILTA